MHLSYYYVFFSFIRKTTDTVSEIFLLIPLTKRLCNSNFLRLITSFHMSSLLIRWVSAHFGGGLDRLESFLDACSLISVLFLYIPVSVANVIITKSIKFLETFFYGLFSSIISKLTFVECGDFNLCLSKNARHEI